MPGSSTMAGVAGDAGAFAFMPTKDKPRKARRQRWPQDVYGFQWHIDRSKPCQIFPNELSDSEIYCIGLLTVQWAYLEHALLIRTALLANKAKIPLPMDATSLSFKRRAAAFRQIVKETVKAQWLRETYLNLAARMANAGDSRHKLTHGLWEWYINKPKRLRVSSFRPPVAFEDHFGIDRIIRLIDRVGEIGFALTYPPRRRQPNEPPAPSRRAYMSRPMLLDPRETWQPAQALPSAVNPISPPPRSASQELPQS